MSENRIALVTGANKGLGLETSRQLARSGVKVLMGARDVQRGEAASKTLRDEGHDVSAVHLRYINPLPPDLDEVMGRFKKVIVPEINLGQLCFVLRAHFLVDATSLNQIRGKPFRKKFNGATRRGGKEPKNIFLQVNIRFNENRYINGISNASDGCGMGRVPILWCKA